MNYPSTPRDKDTFALEIIARLIDAGGKPDRWVANRDLGGTTEFEVWLALRRTAQLHNSRLRVQLTCIGIPDKWAGAICRVKTRVEQR